MTRIVLAAVVAVVAWSTAACDAGSTPPSLDSNSNWLTRCDETAPCASELACVCGVCTVECASDDVCADLGIGGTCAGSASSAVLGFCAEAAGERPPDAAGVCLASCATTNDCAPGQQCMDGACAPGASFGAGDEAPDTGTLDAADASTADTATDTLPGDADPELRCPGDREFYCGPAVGGAPADLMRCVDGQFALETTCELVCMPRPALEDTCAVACNPAEDFYCAPELGLDGEDIYVCMEGVSRFERQCPFGCDPSGDSPARCRPPQP